ncbi:hypothetical protein D3C75_981260 [compost metagenome]
MFKRLQHFLDARAFRFVGHQNAVRAGCDDQVFRSDYCDRNVQLIDQAGPFGIGGHEAFAHVVAAHFLGEGIPCAKILPEPGVRLNDDILLFFHHFVVKADG